MKKYPILIVLLLAWSLNSFAQGGIFKEKREQIRSLKVAFITDKLQLTSAEAEKFWPLYNALDEKQQTLRQEKLRSFIERKDDNTVDKMSEKDASNLLSQIEITEDEMYQSRKKFITSLKGILSSVKIIKLKKAEEEFNRKLLKQYKEKGRRR